MCIIVVKPSSVVVSRSILENCFANNPDGAGYMFANEGKVLIKKGFFDFEEFYESLEKTRRVIGDTAPVVFHFRISTGGMIDKTNSHPHRIATDLAFVHNGILWNVRKTSKVSDTIQYRDGYLSGMIGDDLKKHGLFNLIASHIGLGNKFVFLNGRGEYVICNERSGVWDGELWFSNTTYAAKEFSYSGRYDYNEWNDRGDALSEDCPAYCDECGEELLSDAEINLGTCNLCGANVYGDEWEQFTSLAARSVGERGIHAKR